MNEEEVDVHSKKIRQSRLAMRHRLRKILDELSHNREFLMDVKSGKREFESILKHVSDLFHQDVMENVRELNLDALITKELALILKAHAQKLTDSLSRSPHQFERFQNSLSMKMGNTGTLTLNWTDLGSAVRKGWFHQSPIVTMNGPIMRIGKLRIPKRMRTNKDKLLGPTERADMIHTQGEIEGFDEATNMRVKRLLEFFCETSGGNIDMLQVLVDPTDPIQTIENLFDFSFLIKEKQVGETLNIMHNLPLIIVGDAVKLPDARRQMVLSMNMQELSMLSDALLNESSTHPLHRTDGLYYAREIHEQMGILSTESENIRSSKKQKIEGLKLLNHN